jgi:hypothetical protein
LENIHEKLTFQTECQVKYVLLQKLLFRILKKNLINTDLFIYTMLDTLCNQTATIKIKLIQNGIEMTPPTILHINKFKQLDEEYKQMTSALQLPIERSIFKNAQQIFMACSGKYYRIHNLLDLFKASTSTLQYIQTYE